MTPEQQEYNTQIKNKLQKVKGHSPVIFVAASLRRIEDSHFFIRHELFFVPFFAFKRKERN